VARVCIFCGVKADSYEHVFPDWINNVVLGEEFESQHVQVEYGEVAKQRSYQTNKAASLRAKIVCEVCNGGWMSDLEREASALLEPLMRGVRTTLDMPQQLLAAQWAIKTAMVGETIMYEQSSFSQEDRDLVRQQRRPPLRARVLIAAFALDAPIPTRYTRGLGNVKRDGTPFIDVYVHTIQVLHLVFAIRGTDTFAATDNRSLEHIAEPHYLEIPIFPPVERCRWPPNLVMDEATLIAYSGGRNLDDGGRS
jgi:hypothetical protein